MEQRPFSELTDQTLQQGLKKRKQSQIFAALFVGFSIGVAVWAASHKEGFWLLSYPFW